MLPRPLHDTSRHTSHPRAWVIGLLLAAAVAVLPAVFLPAASSSAQGLEPTPNPALRLATPVIPENPTQADRGRMLYWVHCMPCHGDRGQGLTDEWRGVWVEDHQDCWARGCHSGRPGDEGFPIPRQVPAVIGSPTTLARFAGAAELAAYLQEAHPPQRPGALGSEDCGSLAAFLLEANGARPSSPSEGAAGTSWALAALTVCALVLAGLGLLARRRP